MTPQDLKEALSGITTISITPFTESGDFDVDGYAKNLEFMIEGGVDSSNSVIVVGGSTGECGAMTLDERIKVVETAISVGGDRLRVIAGGNSTNVDESIALAKAAEKVGAVGIMALAPYYYPAKDNRSILDFYKKLAANTDLGILIYNNLEVMGIDMPIEVIDELADLPNVSGLKECTPSFYKMGRVADVAGDRLAVVNGHGEFLEPFAAANGTSGFISSIANFAPRVSSAIWEARSTGDVARTLELRDGLKPYMDLAGRYSASGGEYKVISLIKYITDSVGSVGGFPRIPCPNLSEEERVEIDAVLTTCAFGN